MSDQIDYRAVRQRVEEGVQKQKKVARWIFLGVSIFMFILFLVIAWGMYLGSSRPQLSDDPTTGAMIMLSVGWGATILFHFATLMFDTKFGEQSIRDRVIARELGRELLQMDDEESREKRKHIMRLTDDGELEAVTDEFVETPHQQMKG